MIFYVLLLLVYFSSNPFDVLKVRKWRNILAVDFAPLNIPDIFRIDSQLYNHLDSFPSSRFLSK